MPYPPRSLLSKQRSEYKNILEKALKTPHKTLLAVALLATITCQRGALAADLLWFSDIGPKVAKTLKSEHAEHARHDKSAKSGDGLDAAISEAGDNLHSGEKRLWMRLGDDPAKAVYVRAEEVATEVDLLDAQGKRRRIELARAGGFAQLQCELEEMGFYNAYLTRKVVSDGVLNVQLAKAELLKGSCCGKMGEVDPAQLKAISDPTQPLEIVREHEPDEKLFTRIVSGDKLVLTVNRLGQPLAGAQVTMLTQQGWQKKASADANGRVEFTMIRDYFPKWSDFKRRTKETFVLVAEAQADEPGELQGQAYSKVHYQATLSGKYQVSPYDYKSYAWGLGVTLFVIIFGGLGVYIYRRRRVKPYKEVRFNESA